MNLKHAFQIALPAFASIICTSCMYTEEMIGNGLIIVKEQDVSSFTGIDVSGSADVELTRGDSLSVSLSEYENLIDYWEVKVNNSTLIIKIKPFTSLVNSKAKVTIVMPDSLESLSISGSGSTTMDGAFEQLHTIRITGSGNVYVNSNTNFSEMNTSISGSGNISLKGIAQQLNATTLGSGNLYAGELSAQQADCLVSGSGDMHVLVSDLLKARILGSGDIFYSGTPQIDVQLTGSGRLKPE